MKDSAGRIGCGAVALWSIGVIIALAVIPNVVTSFRTGFDDARATAQDRQTPKVSIAFTSDPEGATVYIDGERTGTTPTTASVPKDRVVRYRLVAAEPYDDYSLFKPYTGTITASQNDAIDVWIPRTSAEEQAQQRERAAQMRREREAERRRAQERRERELEARRLYYRIDTNCRQGANLTYSNQHGDTTQHSNQGSGWYYWFIPQSGDFLYISAQNQCDYGYVTVKIVQNGVTLRENTSSGAYVIATVSARW